MAQDTRQSAKGQAGQPRMSREEIQAARAKAEQLVEQIAGWLEKFELTHIVRSRQGGAVVAELKATPTAWEVAHRFAVRLGGKYLGVPTIFYPPSQAGLIMKVLEAVAGAGYQPTPYSFFRWWPRQGGDDSAEKYLRDPKVYAVVEAALNGFTPAKPRTSAEMRVFDEEARFINFLKRCKPREGKPTATAATTIPVDLENDLNGGLDEPPAAADLDLGGEADLEEELPPLTDPDLEADLGPEPKADPIAAIRALAATDPTAIVIVKNIDAGKIDKEKALAYARVNRLPGFRPGEKFGK